MLPVTCSHSEYIVPRKMMQHADCSFCILDVLMSKWCFQLPKLSLRSRHDLCSTSVCFTNLLRAFDGACLINGYAPHSKSWAMRWIIPYKIGAGICSHIECLTHRRKIKISRGTEIQRQSSHVQYHTVPVRICNLWLYCSIALCPSNWVPNHPKSRS